MNYILIALLMLYAFAKFMFYQSLMRRINEQDKIIGQMLEQNLKMAKLLRELCNEKT